MPEACSGFGNQPWSRRLPPGESPGARHEVARRGLLQCRQAGLEDFAYMEGVEDETQLKERIVVTGSEVHSFSLLQYEMHPSIWDGTSENIIGAGWAEQLHLG